MDVGARLIALITAGTLVAGMTACPNRKTSQEAPVGGTDLGNLSLVKPDRSLLDPPILQRALRLPQVATDEGCPLTRGASRAGSFELGTGPVRLIIDARRDRSGVYHYGASHLYNGWRLIAASWVIEPGAKGAIFIHGRRLDANQGVWFLPTIDSRNMYRTIAIGPLPEIELYRWLLLPAQGDASGGRSVDGGAGLRGPGCFGVQADGTGFSSMIVFQLER